MRSFLKESGFLYENFVWYGGARIFGGSLKPSGNFSTQISFPFFFHNLRIYFFLKKVGRWVNGNEEY